MKKNGLLDHPELQKMILKKIFDSREEEYWYSNFIGDSKYSLWVFFSYLDVDLLEKGFLIKGFQYEICSRDSRDLQEYFIRSKFFEEITNQKKLIDLCLEEAFRFLPDALSGEWEAAMNGLNGFRAT